MSLRIARFLAWRYVQQATRQSTIQTMIWVCLASIFVGTFSLTLILSIMSGFESATHTKLQGVYPDIILEAPPGKFLDAPALSNYLQSEYPHDIKALCTYSSQQVLVHHTDQHEPTSVSILKGIIPEEEALVSALHTKSSLPLQEIQSKLQGPCVLIGKKLAETLEVIEGQTITLLYTTDPQAKPNSMTFSSATATIIGYISTGIAEYDNALLIAHQSFVKHLFEDDCINEIGIKISPHVNAKTFIETLKTLPDVAAYRWQDLYPSLVSALKLEKYVMGFLLGLITLVACMNNISLLFMFITSKKREIALLKTFGTPVTTLTCTFLLFNSIISAIGATAGLITAYAAGLFLQSYPLIELPDVYYVTHIPITLDPFIFIMVFIIVLILSIITACIPLTSIKKINITHTLRFE